MCNSGTHDQLLWYPSASLIKLIMWPKRIAVLTDVHTDVYFCLHFFFMYEENMSRGAARYLARIKYKWITFISSVHISIRY